MENEKQINKTGSRSGIWKRYRTLIVAGVAAAFMTALPTFMDIESYFAFYEGPANFPGMVFGKVKDIVNDERVLYPLFDQEPGLGCYLLG